jgi:hypothetical protein
MLATPLASRDQCVSSRRRKPRGCGALRRLLDVRRDLLAEPTPIQAARAGFCVRRAERVHHGGVAAAVAGDDHAPESVNGRSLQKSLSAHRHNVVSHMSCRSCERRRSPHDRRRASRPEHKSLDVRGFLQSPLTDSNRRPPPYHGGALPTELRGRSPAKCNRRFEDLSELVRAALRARPAASPGREERAQAGRAAASARDRERAAEQFDAA